MNPESNGLAPGGSDTSDGFSAIEGSPSTECRVLALLTHSTVCPALIVTLSGRNCGGLSLILITTAGAGAPKAGNSIDKPNEAVTAVKMMKKRTTANLNGPNCDFTIVPLV